LQPITEEEQNDRQFDPFKYQIVSFDYENYVQSDRSQIDRELQN
jgi:hypothetical protein